MVSEKLFFCIHSTNTTINANMAAPFFVWIANIAAMTSLVLASCRPEMSSNKTSYTGNNAETMATFFVVLLYDYCIRKVSLLYL